MKPADGQTDTTATLHIHFMHFMQRIIIIIKKIKMAQMMLDPITS